MGHLFAAGGRTVEDDGVRDLYVGNLGNVSATIFPDYVDYVALGHLHVPQIVNKSEHIRYCGSPLPMGFGEAEQQKIVCVVDFLPAECAGTNGSGGPDTVKSGWKTQVSPIEVPVFQRLVSVSGTRNHIITQVSELVASGCSAWLEIVYKDADIISDLGDKLNELVAGTNLEILCIRNNQIMEGKGPSIDDEETLADLSEVDVFEMCLTARGVAEDRRPDLMLAYSEILALVRQDNVATEPANQKRG
jgi:exonuclease SbcD